MRTLICGSIAFDTIMVFPGQFKDHILPDQVHILNVAFLVPEMRREFGGCAGNIAYSLKLLGGAPIPMATIGDDGTDYVKRLAALDIDTSCLRKIPGQFTAQAFITTDMADNQITAFHPGAMNHAHLNHVDEVQRTGPIALGIVAPDGRDGMLQHASEFSTAGIPFIFDPGQGLPMFNGTELLGFIDQARYVAVNDYEGRLLVERTGLTLEQLASRVEALIVTRGAEGSHIYTHGQRLDIPCVPAAQLADPTGCGDAFRSGLLYGIARGMDWLTTGRLASTLGAIKIEHKGPQNHRIDRDGIARRYRSAWGADPW